MAIDIIHMQLVGHAWDIKDIHLCQSMQAHISLLGAAHGRAITAEQFNAYRASADRQLQEFLQAQAMGYRPLVGRFYWNQDQHSTHGQGGPEVDTYEWADLDPGTFLQQNLLRMQHVMGVAVWDMRWAFRMQFADARRAAIYSP